MDFFSRLITRIEKSKDFAPFLLIYFLTIAAQLILQPITRPGQPFVFYFYHTLYYTTVSLGLIILLGLATGEKLIKITKTICVFILVILLAPLVNRVIETFTIVVLIFAYGRLKTASWFKAGLIALLSFLTIAFFRSIPLWLNFNSLLIVQFLLILNFLALAGYFYLHNPSAFADFWNKVEVTTLLSYSGIFMLGAALKKHGLALHNLNDILSGLTACLCIVYAYLFLRMLTDLVNYEIDKLSREVNPLTKNSISPLVYQFLLFLVTGLALACGYFSKADGAVPLLLTGLFLLSNFLYLVPPFSLKQLPVLSKAMISCCCGCMILYGYYFSQNTLAGFPLGILWYFLIFFTLALNFLDIRSQKIDSYCYFFTLPTILKIDTAKKIIGFFVLSAFLLAPFVFKIPFLFPLMLIVGLTEFYLINRKQNYNEKLVFYIYLAALYAMILLFSFTP